MCVCGCYSPHYSDCLITCANSGDCPNGLTCDGTYCRSGSMQESCGEILSDAGPMDANPDRDNDGKLNADDNCPDSANADQADEDGDMVGDACDPCPPFPSPTDNHDSDGDGVGDGCDPDPITPVNHIHLFEGFNASTLGGGGTATPAADWTIGGGKATVLGVSSSSVPHLMTWPLPQGGTAETVLSHFQLKGINSTTRPLGVGVVTQWTDSTLTGLGCWVGYETTTNNGNLKLFEYSQSAPLGLANDPVTVNEFFTTDITRRNGALSCNEPNAVTNLSSGSNVRGPSAGLLAKATNATFDWVLIVSGSAP
jgi:hypothetical protein